MRKRSSSPPTYKSFDFKTTENISQSRLRAVPPHERRYEKPKPEEEQKPQIPQLRSTSQREQIVKHVKEEQAQPLRREKTPSPEPVREVRRARSPSPEPEPVKFSLPKRKQSPVKRFTEPERNPTPEHLAYVPPERKPVSVKHQSFVEPIRKPSPENVNRIPPERNYSSSEPIYALPKRKQSPVKRFVEPERNSSPDPATFILPPKRISPEKQVEEPQKDPSEMYSLPKKKSPLRKQSAEDEKKTQVNYMLMDH